MDTAPLRTWLGLPPGPWPPADRELLGLGPGPVALAEVEQRALEQMEKLRPHQLVQPELVTEGMNRLAQALIALSAPGAADEAPPAPPPPPRPRAKRHRPRPPTAEPVLDAEPVAAEPVRPQAGPFLPPEPPGRDPLIADELPRRPDELPAEPAVLAPPPPADRRQGYAALVRLRRLRRALDGLRPFFADPGEQVLTPAAVFAWVRAVREFRRALAGPPGDWPVPHGRLVVRVVTQPFALSVFRSLVPSQRQALAADWALATDELGDRYRLTRRALNHTKPGNRLGVNVRAARTWFRDNPEWVLVLTAGVAFVIALVRTVAARGAT